MSTNSALIIYIAVISVSYLVGSIPFGVILAKIFKLGNLRQQGSGNIGATNVARIGGKKLGILAVILDSGKVWLPILIANLYNFPQFELTLVVLSAVIGHMFPLWLSFKGGKGVATTIGGLIGLNVLLAFVFIITWVAVFILSRLSSLASMIAVILTAIISYYVLPFNDSIILNILAILILYKHKDNILRLFQGKEKKLIL